MPLLSSPVSELKPLYDVIIIGSGYGGAISASLLARSKKANGTPVSVCLLERGKEIPIGNFPNTPETAGLQFQVNAAGHQLGEEDALYWLHSGEDISVFQGCGLGGTSLVNANVVIAPEERVWKDKRWPQALLDDLGGGMKAGYARAARALGANPYPATYPQLKKYEALRKSAQHLQAADCYHPDIAVTFEDQLNAVGVRQPACNGCGDCTSGCNTGSKNTLVMNYIPDAKNHGAQIFCSMRVQSVEQAGEGWRVRFQPSGCDRKKFDAPDMFVDAKVVVLSAGAIGSSEILLRSKQRGLSCSDAVGKSFSGNGDFLGFGYNNDQEINGMGLGERPADERAPGPCITGIVDRRKLPEYKDTHVIEEGVVPGALVPLLPNVLKKVADLTGTDTDKGLWDGIREAARSWASALPGGGYRGAMANTQTYLIMSHDDSGGRIRLEHEGTKIDWPGVGESKHFKQLSDVLLEATSATGGTYVPAPMFNKAFDYGLVTVHPLGGCSMAETAAQGGTNHKGQVFSNGKGDACYSNLYVNDGSVLPCSVGVNPLLTISAIAERNARLLIREREWLVDESPSQGPAAFDGTPQERGTKLQFTEKMGGYISTAVLAPGAFAQAESEGKKEQSACEFVLTVCSSDIDEMIADPQHAAAIMGTVVAPSLSPAPMTVTAGTFNLFVQDNDKASLKRMRYDLLLRAESGESFSFYGEKLIRDDAGADMWSDTTTLYVTIRRGDIKDGPLLGQGILHIAESDFALQMTTMKATKASGAPAPLAVARFGELFARSLWDTYGVQA
jgi:cholesterol oxidase